MSNFTLFLIIQLASLVLTVLGVPVCAVLAYGEFSRPVNGAWHWPRWAWIWDNDIDGVCPHWYEVAHADWSIARREFVWSALRNPANNLRFVPGVSKIGRPLWRYTWGAKPGGWYFAAGWNASGYPVLSAGRNVNPY